MSSLPLSTLARGAAVLSAALVALACGACAAPAGGQDAAPPDPEADSGSNTAGTAQLVMDDATFTFTLAHCAVTATDALAHGPGQNDGTQEPAYLDVDLVLDGTTTGGVSVDLGATSRFESSDDAYTFDTEYFAGDYALQFRDGELELEADFHRGGPESTSTGTLTVAC